jgi:hypothetical protein
MLGGDKEEEMGERKRTIEREGGREDRRGAEM